MLQLVIPDVEYWDEQSEEFVTKFGQTLQLEHSLVSISKWESKWCKAFLGKKDKTNEETIDYIKCMTLTPDVNPEVYANLTDENLAKVREYIQAPMTATCLPEDKKSKGGSREVVTSELIYCWMIMLGIPVKFEEWHINRLITLIKVCNLKNKSPKKRGAKETARSYAELNAARRKRLNSKG